MLFAVCLIAALACQKTQVAEYKKLQNDGEVPRVSADDAKKDVDAGNAVVVDSRAETAFKQEHIAGAINFPFGFKDDFSSLPKGKKILVYCD